MISLVKEGFKSTDQKGKNSKKRGYAAWFWFYEGMSLWLLRVGVGDLGG